ncbi:MAG: hypothetical protein IJ906_16090, partial [Oscillospiraceae bacterium]|nr:hypothetical protein [Oscillospiraceae bacterium]
MRERTELLIRGMTENRTKRHRWLAMVTALAFLTGGNVFWSLREIGTAVTEDDLCTREAHEHSEECYDENGNLICGKEEHVHTAACFSDENADVETAEIWEATLPECAGLPRQEQTALIAESQLGYTESMNNFILGEDGTQHGYTRYGAWYGNPYGEWNTMFTYFCLSYAGVSTDEIPCGGNARTWQVKLTENELIRPPDTAAERGEIVLLDLDADGEADLTGIVTDAAETLHFVEGDLGHAVAEGELSPDAEQILGYVAIPEPDSSDAENPEESSPDAESAPTEEQPAVSESEQPLVTYKAESASGIQVSAVTAEGVFPADTVMTVTDVPREEALQAAAEGLSADAAALDAVAVDISFYASDGTELEPDGGVDVEITLPETQQLAGENYTLLHVADDGAVQTMEAEFADDAVTFTADSFSIYVLVNNQEVQKDQLIPDGNNGYINNSESNPYVVTIGSNFTVVGYTTNNTATLYRGNNETIISSISEKKSNASEGSYRLERTFKAVSTGDTTVKLELGDGTIATLYVRVQLPPENDIYVVRSDREIDKDLLYKGDSSDQYIANSQDHPYHIMLGESITLAGYSSTSINDAWLFLDSNDAILDFSNATMQDCDGTHRAGLQVTGKAVGVSKVNQQTSDGHYEQFWIEVMPHEMNDERKLRDIYVKTALDDRNIDQVNEWLSGFGFPNPNNIGYIPNRIRLSDGKVKLFPYLLSVGQSGEFYVPVDQANASMTFTAKKIPFVDRTDGDMLTVVFGNLTTGMTDATSEQLTITSTGTGAVKIEAKESGLYRVTLKEGDT